MRSSRSTPRATKPCPLLAGVAVWACVGGLGQAQAPEAASPLTTGAAKYLAFSEVIVGVVDVDAADVDGDGDQDLIALTDTLVVFLGNGFGDFRPGPISPLASVGSVQELTVGDLNADAIPDVVVTQSIHGGSVYVYLGDGSGGFAFGGGPSSVAGGAESPQIGDVDGDGHADVVALSDFPSRIQVFQGDGAGQLVLGGSTSVGGDGVLALRDFDGDGRLDAAISIGSLAGFFVEVHAGDGAGAFLLRGSQGTDEGSDSLAVCDLDGDGDLDLLNAENGTNAISYLENPGNGAIFPPVETQTLGFAADVVALDIELDGTFEAVVGSFSSNGGRPGTLRLLEPNGDGTFTVTETWQADIDRAQVVHLDADGFPDLVGGRAFIPESSVTVVRNDGAGGFHAARPYALDPFNNSPLKAAFADFDGNGVPDIALTYELQGSFGIYLADGAGGYGPRTLFAAGPSTGGEIEAGDWDADGIVDLCFAKSWLFASNTDEFQVWLGAGDGTFAVATQQPEEFEFDVYLELMDWNADGNLDALAGAMDKMDAGKVLLALGDGSTGVASTLRHDLGVETLDAAVADWDRDGILDAIFSAEGMEDLLLVPGDGLGGFGAATTIAIEPGATPRELVATDWDADGSLDLIATGEPTTFEPCPVWLLTQPQGTGLGLAHRTAIGTESVDPVVLDYDGDGHLDLVSLDSGEGGIVNVVLGSIDGGFLQGFHLDATGDANAQITADHDLDGRLETLAMTTASQALIELRERDLCQDDIGFGGPGDALLSLCGDELELGGTAEMRVDGGRPGAFGYAIGSSSLYPTPVLGGLVVPLPIEWLQPLRLDGAGSWSLPSVTGTGIAFHFYVQAGYVDPATPFGLALTNALAVEFL